MQYYMEFETNDGHTLWVDVPDGANLVAQDGNGLWFFYKEYPRLNIEWEEYIPSEADEELNDWDREIQGPIPKDWRKEVYEIVRPGNESAVSKNIPRGYTEDEDLKSFIEEAIESATLACDDVVGRIKLLKADLEDILEVN